jgi:hypothetical protein
MQDSILGGMMGSAAAVIQTFQSDEWNADVYGAFSVVSNIAAHVKNRANVVHLGYSLFMMNRRLKAIFDKIYAVAEGKIKAEPTNEPVTEERAREMASDMMRMYRSLENLYESLRRAGLRNNSLTSGQLLRLREHCDTMLDLADWIDTAIATEEVNAIFARASQEREHGDIYDLEQVR